jgi:hypothetical protein
MKKSDLTELYKRGLISSKPFEYIEIKDKVTQYISQGLTKTESIIRTKKLLKCSDRKIWNALKVTDGLQIS